MPPDNHFGVTSRFSIIFYSDQKRYFFPKGTFNERSLVLFKVYLFSRKATMTETDEEDSGAVAERTRDGLGAKPIKIQVSSSYHSTSLPTTTNHRIPNWLLAVFLLQAAGHSSHVVKEMFFLHFWGRFPSTLGGSGLNSCTRSPVTPIPIIPPFFFPLGLPPTQIKSITCVRVLRKPL